MRKLYSELQQTLLLDERFSVFFHRFSHLNPSVRIKEGVLHGKRYTEVIQYITNASSATHKADSGISEDHLSGYICYAAKPNSFMIRANGSFGKCTVALADERNSIGHITEDGSLIMSTENLQKWFHGFSTLSPKRWAARFLRLREGGIFYA